MPLYQTIQPLLNIASNMMTVTVAVTVTVMETVMRMMCHYKNQPLLNIASNAMPLLKPKPTQILMVMVVMMIVMVTRMMMCPMYNTILSLLNIE